MAVKISTGHLVIMGSNIVNWFDTLEAATEYAKLQVLAGAGDPMHVVQTIQYTEV